METVRLLFYKSRSCLDGSLVQKNFVKTVRAVEIILGIPIDGTPQNFLNAMSALPSTNFTAALNGACQSNVFSPEVAAALLDTVPILNSLSLSDYMQGILTMSPFDCHDKKPIVTK